MLAAGRRGAGSCGSRSGLLRRDPWPGAGQPVACCRSATGDLNLRARGVRDHSRRSTTCVLFSMLPAWRASRVDPIDALKQQTRSSAGAATSGGRAHWCRRKSRSSSFCSPAPDLLLRSFVKLNQVDLGFQSRRPGRARHPDAAEASHRAWRGARVHAGAWSSRVEIRARRARDDRVERLPSGGAATRRRASGSRRTAGAHQTGSSLPSSRVSEDFFEVLGIPLLEGRTFIPEDGEDAIITQRRPGATVFRQHIADWTAIQDQHHAAVADRGRRRSATSRRWVRRCRWRRHGGLRADRGPAAESNS